MCIKDIMLREIRDFGDTKGNYSVAFEWHMPINREICHPDGGPTGRSGNFRFCFQDLSIRVKSGILRRNIK